MVSSQLVRIKIVLYFSTDSCDNMLGIAGITHASSAKLPCCPSEYVRDAASTVDLHWEAWKDGNGVRTAEEYIQFDFTKKTTVRRINTLGFVKTKQFVRSYYVLYSQDGAHWKYVTEMGKKKARINGNILTNIFCMEEFFGHFLP